MDRATGGIDPSNADEKLYGLHDRNPELMKRIIGNQSPIRSLVSLLGPNVVLVKNRHVYATINNRQAEPTQGVHRDIFQSTRGFMAAVVYLQDSTVNGRRYKSSAWFSWFTVRAPQVDGAGAWV